MIKYFLILSFSIAHFSFAIDKVAKPAAVIVPDELKAVSITEHLGEQLNLNLEFKDESGKKVYLKEFFNKNRPVMLSLVYYSCPNLCNLHLNGVVDAFKNFPWTPGKQFEYITVSIDPKEDPELARQKKGSFLGEYGRAEAAPGIHMLTGTKENIDQLAKAVGFGFKWDEESKQWAHSSAAIVFTGEGKISRYLYGILFVPNTFRLALTEASENKIGNIVDHLLLFCFHYDPKARKYSIYAFNIMRAGGALTVLMLGMFLVPYWYVRKKKKE